MKKLAPFILLFTSTFFCNVLSAQTSYNVDVKNSTINWNAKKVTGSGHNGTLAISEGVLVFENDKLVNGTFILNMDGIIVLDTKSKRLLNHLKNKDFFDVKKHPTATFQITDSEIKDNDKTLIKGKLTLKGITQNISFLATITSEDNNLSFKSDDFTIDRTLWGIKYKSGKFFDNLKNRMINDDIKINVSLSANK